MSSDFDSLYDRLKATRKRQAEILADTDKQLSALDRLMGKDKQVDLVDTASAEVNKTGRK